MDLVPSEIWMQIFSMACTDGGFTGRSLELVSKNFQSVSQIYKYQSMSIKTARQILTFDKILGNLPKDCTKVQHLLLAWQLTDTTMNELAEDKNLFPSIAERAELRALSFFPDDVRMGGEILGSINNIMFSAFQRILTCVAQTLSTLSVYWHTDYSMTLCSFLTIHLPNLISLSIYSDSIFHKGLDYEDDYTEAAQSFPSLLRLQARGFLEWSPSDSFTITEIGARATHLRFPYELLRLNPCIEPIPFTTRILILDDPMERLPSNAMFESMAKRLLGFNDDTGNPRRLKVICSDQICTQDYWEEFWKSEIKGEEGLWSVN